MAAEGWFERGLTWALLILATERKYALDKRIAAIRKELADDDGVGLGSSALSSSVPSRSTDAG